MLNPGMGKLSSAFSCGALHAYAVAAANTTVFVLSWMQHTNRMLLQAGAGWLAKVTSGWQAGHISNLDYLLYCNLAAGRSFNDLTQVHGCSTGPRSS